MRRTITAICVYWVCGWRYLILTSLLSFSISSMHGFLLFSTSPLCLVLSVFFPDGFLFSLLAPPSHSSQITMSIHCGELTDSLIDIPTQQLSRARTMEQQPTAELLDFEPDARLPLPKLSSRRLATVVNFPFVKGLESGHSHARFIPDGPSTIRNGYTFPRMYVHMTEWWRFKENIRLVRSSVNR
jgi:hypothetical protein